MPNYVPGPKALSNDGTTKVETWAKKREDGYFVAIIRLVDSKMPATEFEIGLIKFPSAPEAHMEAQLTAMRYLGVSRTEDIWTKEYN
jgi:hypothetical protein